MQNDSLSHQIMDPIVKTARSIILPLLLTIYFTVTTFAGPLPDTGQTKCYNSTEEITCPQPGEPFYGQDGNYTIDPPSCTKLDASGNDLPGEATSWVMARDNVTGLIWEVKTDDGSIHDKDNTYTWCDPNSDTNGGEAGTCGDGTDTEDFVNALNEENYGGFCDWRLPTLLELSSIVNSGRHNPTINTEYFPYTASSGYWSSVPGNRGSQGNAWHYSFLYGSSADKVKSGCQHVRAVRGRSINSHAQFLDNGDDTVTDMSTGLMWVQRAAQVMNWKEALTYCENLVHAGYADWRLPNIEELVSIVEHSRLSPAVDIAYFPDTLTGGYWSATTNPYGGQASKEVDFHYGHASSKHKSQQNYVRAVRGGLFVSSGDLAISGSLMSPTNQTGASIFVGGENIISYRYRLEDGSYGADTPVSTGISLTGLSDGSHTLYVIARDADDNWLPEEGATTVSWVVDTIAPALTGLSDDATPSKRRTWMWDAADASAVTYRYLIDQNATWASPTGEYSDTKTASKSGADGTWYLHVQAKDAAGNESDVVSVSAVLAGLIPDTGQTKCYSNTEEIPCPQPGEPFYGQDAQYAIRPPSYTKLDAQGNGLQDEASEWAMAWDHVTGLVWEVKADDGSIHDKDNTYTWCDNNPETNGRDYGHCGDGTDTEDFIDTLNSESYGGFSDWRVPTREELRSIVDYDRTVNTDYFPNTVPASYWSSTTLANRSYEAWLVSFYYGSDGSNFKVFPYYVRAVRGGQSGSSDHFITIGDGTVTDTDTGLMWQQATATDSMNWQNALLYCEDLTLSWYDDWRLPNIMELASLTDLSRQDAAIDTNYFSDTASSYYWSSTTYRKNTGGAWTVHLNGGYDGSHYKSDDHYVRAVRGVKPGPFDNLAISGSLMSPTNQTGASIFVGGENIISYRYRLEDGSYGADTPVSTGISLTGLSDGSHTLYVIARDADDNWLPEEGATTVSWVVDTIAPALTGLSDDATPSKRRTWMWDAADASAVTYRYLIDQNATWASPTGEYSDTKTASKSGADGTWYLHVQAKDAAGNESDIMTVSAVLDNTAPFTTISGTPVNPTNSTTAVLLVSSSDAISYRYELDDEGYSEEIALTAQISLSSLAEGNHTLSVVGKDTAGNWPPNCVAPTYVTWTVDTTSLPPASLDLTSVDDTGKTNSDNTTRNVSDLTITGTGENGATVQLYNGKNAISGATGPVSNGIFSIDMSLTEGIHIITATQTDTATNISAASDPLVITIDTTKPNSPTNLDLMAEDDSGISNSDYITQNTASLTIAGSGENGVSVQLYNADTIIPGATGLVQNDVFSIDVSLGEGTHNLTATQTDIAGNLSAVSGQLVITVDTSNPGTPGSLDLHSDDDSGESDSDNITSNTSGLTVAGSGDENTRAQLFDEGVSIPGAMSAISDGVFSIDLSLAEGSHNLTSVLTDTAGNASTPSDPLTVRVDTIALVPTDLDLSANDDSGASNSDNITNNAVGLTITGSGENGASIQIYDGKSEISGVAGFVSDGTFSIDVSLAADGSHPISVKQTDIAGNASSPSGFLDITIDTAEPSIQIDTPQDNVPIERLWLIEGTSLDGSNTGSLVELQITDGIWYLSDAGYFFLTPVWITVEGESVWSLITSAANWISGTDYMITARATDMAGNSSLSVVTFTYGVVPLSGDIDRDGAITLSDAILAMKIMVGTDSSERTFMFGADVDGDKRIGLPEVIYVLQRLAGL